MEAFKTGDKVRRIKTAWGNLKVGDIRVVQDCVLDSTNNLGLTFEGDENLYVASSFELVSRAEVVILEMQAIPTTQPFDYPETDEDRERAAQAKLRAYKRGMRDWLYGTTSGE